MGQKRWHEVFIGGQATGDKRQVMHETGCVMETGSRSAML
jgi:hypothetical protein